MAIKTYKPTSAGRRFVTVLTNDDLTAGAKPEKSLMHDQRHSGGRNNLGRITTRHIGGGNRRKYRIIDFKRTYLISPLGILIVAYLPSIAMICAEIPALLAIWPPLPGVSSMLCTIVPTGMFSKGSALPTLMSAFTPLITLSPTFKPTGARI